jgi:hypothetical protein
MNEEPFANKISFQQELKSIYFWAQIHFEHFKSEEADYNIPGNLVLGHWI